MALKKACHKLQSSLAHFIFANRELIYIRDNFVWQIFKKKYPAPIVRNKTEWDQMFEAIVLSVLVNHIEIMRQALYEHINYIGEKDVPQKLHNLGKFLFDLRNALSHTKGALIPRWSEKPKTNGLFSIDIPVQKEEAGLSFDFKSKASVGFQANVKPGKTIKITSSTIDKLVILSYHVLFILKKQKRNTLIKYLDRIQTTSSKEDFF